MKHAVLRVAVVVAIVVAGAVGVSFGIHELTTVSTHVALEAFVKVFVDWLFPDKG